MYYRKVQTDHDINVLVEMASVIWRSHFGTLFDKQTVSKLVQAAQSKQVILNQIADRYQYYFINIDSNVVGYFAYQINAVDAELFLAKLYLYEKQRGKGIGRAVLHHLEKLCKEEALNKISLTVYYKNFDSIHAYEHWGFDNLGLIKRHFDDELIFDDIKMEKAIIQI